MKASHFYSFRTRSFLDLDLICQSTRHKAVAWSVPCECKAHQQLLQILQFGTCLWLVHHSSIYTISQEQVSTQADLVSLHFTFLCFTDILGFCFVLYKLEVCGNPASSKSIDTFPPAFVHLVFLCHILVILPIFQTFPSLFYLLSANSDH